MEKLLTLSEAAALINVHPETLRRWDNDKTLLAIRVNDRGDRRYRESDILDFMSTHKTVITHAKTVNIDGYQVKWWNEEGFATMSANFHLIGKLYAVKDNEFIGFAFYVNFFEKIKSDVNENNFDDLATQKVIDYIKSRKVFDGDTTTFEYKNGSFVEVQNPEWWEEKYSKTLVPGLRVEANSTYAVTVENKAWRVLLYFKSKQSDSWLPAGFGPNYNFVEYSVWIDSKELAEFDLPNIQKSAEILAVQFGIDRFEETKDENSNRDITRITEKNSARFNGKWVKDSWLPDELMK